jgi:acyl-coenzyme A synthetase/AMP-(fatty) acid ligase
VIPLNRFIESILSSPAENPADAVLALCEAIGSTPDRVNHAELMLHRHAREGRGGATALYFDGAAYSYNQVAEAAARCTAWLRASGVEPGDCVILALPDCPTLVAAYFGVVAAGAIAIILDPGLSAEDAFYIAQLCKARLTIAHDKALGRLGGLRYVPGMIAVIGVGVHWGTLPEVASAVPLGQQPDDVVHRNPSGHACGLLSSGSTGRPKLIVHRHQDILHGYFGYARPVLGLSAADRVISVAKMTTGYGLGCSLLMPFLRGASSALVSEPPDPAIVADAIQAYRCSLLFAQPRFLADTVPKPELAARLQTLRFVITGGEPLAGALADRWARFSRVELLDSYGATEVGFLYISNRPGEQRLGSVGRPIAGLQVEVVDKGGNPVPVGQVGKLRVRGPMVIDGYWNDPRRTEQSFEDGWFVTSDMFSIDSDGYYYIHGRSDHLIKLGCGDWVNPNELERVLLEHPAVRECAIVGAPDNRGLTALKAFVVVDAGRAAGQELAGELIAMIRDRWPRQEYRWIGAVEFTSALPKTVAGKLDRAQLRPQSMTEFSYKC